MGRNLLLLGALIASLLLAALLGREIQPPRWVVLYSGYVGTGLIIISMTYSIRKRWFKKWGHLKYWLAMHELLSLLGTILIFFHTATRFRTGIPALALVLMTIVVVSGFAGMHLYRDFARFRAKAKNRFSAKAADYAQRRLKSWRIWHVQLSAALSVFAVLHLVLVAFFGGLK